MNGQLDWLRGGLLLGLAFFLAIALVKPIGVSTQFVIADGILLRLVDATVVVPDEAAGSGYSSPYAYLDKSGGKYAKNIAQPLNYSFVFVLAILAGALLSRWTRGPAPSDADRVAPAVWRERFGMSGSKRYAWTFAAGFLVLFGARLAGGCTSGHMMSGMMQSALSGYLFSVAAFGTAIPTALWVYSARASD